VGTLLAFPELNNFVNYRYALALLPYVDSAAIYRNLVVIDIKEKRILGGCTVPHSR